MDCPHCQRPTSDKAARLVQRNRAARLDDRLRRLERVQRENASDIHGLSLRQRLHMTFDMFGFF